MIKNPFGIYVYSFALVILLYHFQWSEFYPDLSLDVIIFLSITFAISFFMYRATKNYLKIVPGQYKSYNLLRISSIIIVLVALNIAYINQVPILTSYKGLVEINTKELDYFPILFPFTTASVYYFGVVLYYNYLVSKEIKYLVVSLLLLVPHILFIQRGMAFAQLTTCAFVYIFCRPAVNLKIIIMIIVMALAGSQLFSLLGTIRDENSKYYRPITEMGGASKAFYERSGNVGHFYLWLYLTSPLANFQKNVVLNNTTSSKAGLEDFLVLEVIPDAISKRFVDIDHLKEQFRDFRIVETLNVGTMYTRSYSLLGWYGATMIYFILSVILLIYIKLLSSLQKDRSDLAIVGLAIACNFTLMQVFTNMIPNSARLFPLFFPLFTLFLLKFNFKLRLK